MALEKTILTNNLSININTQPLSLIINIIYSFVFWHEVKIYWWLGLLVTGVKSGDNCELYSSSYNYCVDIFSAQIVCFIYYFEDFHVSMHSRNWRKCFANVLNSVIPYDLYQDMGYTIRTHHSWFLSPLTPPQC